jgi:DNA polymerase I-like protein with 3'-5' exonuclease and polymerase domains
MIIKCDAKGLEWVVAVYLSQDPVAMQEIIDGVDQHSNNQRAFNLPERLIAKIFLFRIIFANLDYAAFTYANDPEFTPTSSSKKFWQRVIDEFVAKYSRFAQWHIELVQQVTMTGQLVMPTGRVYKFERVRGEWPVTQIYNYPVQGLGADIMSIIRVSFKRRFDAAKINGVIVNTVHDDIVCDIHPSEQERVRALFHDVFADFPSNFKRLFGVEFNLPLRCEVSVGPNMKEVVELK